MSKKIFILFLFIYIFFSFYTDHIYSNEKKSSNNTINKVLFGFFTSNKGVLLTREKEEMFEKDLSVYLNKHNENYLLSYNVYSKDAPVSREEKLEYYKKICLMNNFDILIYGELYIYNRNNMNIIIYALDVNKNIIISKKIINNSYTYDISQTVNEYAKILLNKNIDEIDMNKIYGRLTENEVTKKNKISKYKRKSNAIFTTSMFFIGAGGVSAVPSIVLLAVGLYLYSEFTVSNDPTMMLYVFIACAALGVPALIFLMIGGIIAIGGYVYTRRLKKLSLIKPQIKINENKINISFSFNL